nr:MAG TPA_asm: hypothetical protein [Caudoviricetes sp.]
MSRNCVIGLFTKRLNRLPSVLFDELSENGKGFQERAVNAAGMIKASATCLLFSRGQTVKQALIA